MVWYMELKVKEFSVFECIELILKTYFTESKVEVNVFKCLFLWPPSLSLYRSVYLVSEKNTAEK